MDYQAEIEKVLNDDAGYTATHAERLERARLLAEQGILEELKRLNKLLDSVITSGGHIRIAK